MEEAINGHDAVGMSLMENVPTTNKGSSSNMRTFASKHFGMLQYNGFRTGNLNVMNVKGQSC